MWREALNWKDIAPCFPRFSFVSVKASPRIILELSLATCNFSS
jgi:hypothetical protein